MRLSDRQREIVRLIATGHTYREIGRALGVAQRTVRWHCARIVSGLPDEPTSQRGPWSTRQRIRDHAAQLLAA